MEWAADKVERIPVARLVPSARNARTHSEAQVDQIAASIREWGWTMPVLVDEAGGIVAGHGRVMAASKLGIEDVPCMTARGWSKQQIAAYRIADNKLALNGGWDDSLLKAEFAELEAGGFDIGLTGFADQELAAIRVDLNSGLTDPDEAPEAPQKPVSALGDVWLLGPHRLVCGDSTAQEAVAAALGGARPHLMVTDPPYGVDYDPNWRHEAAARGLIGFPAKRNGKIENDDRIDWSPAWALFPGDVAYVWHAGRHASKVQASLESAKFNIRCQIIWAKDSFSISRGDYHWQHEPCWYAVRRQRKGHWAGDRSQSTLWRINKRDGMDQGTHNSQKPVECMKRPIENNSSPGQSAYDPFVGSGTTIIAAEMTGRACIGIEIDPAYIDVAVLRWQAFTGKQATLDGKAFDEVRAEREKQAA
jgi:DNA modification methylase